MKGPIPEDDETKLTVIPGCNGHDVKIDEKQASEAQSETKPEESIETQASEAKTALQAFLPDPVKNDRSKAPHVARPRSAMGAASMISNISSAVLSKPRISPERSILLTPAKRALHTDLRIKGHLKHQRLKKVHFQLPKGTKRTVVRSLNPKMQFVQRWLKFMVVPLSYEVWAFPFRLALGYPTMDLNDATLLADALCDAAFAIDMAISLVTAVAVPGRDDFVTSFSEISRHYFRNTFPFQVLPSVAFWIATSICGPAFSAVCPYSSTPAAQSVHGARLLDRAEHGGAQWECVMASQHWSLWVWWAITIPRLVPRFLRLRVYFKSMELNLVRPTRPPSPTPK
jgi:hypothetical protein